MTEKGEEMGAGWKERGGGDVYIDLGWIRPWKRKKASSSKHVRG